VNRPGAGKDSVIKVLFGKRKKKEGDIHKKYTERFDRGERKAM